MSAQRWVEEPLEKPAILPFSTPPPLREHSRHDINHHTIDFLKRHSRAIVAQVLKDDELHRSDEHAFERSVRQSEETRRYLRQAILHPHDTGQSLHLCMAVLFHGIGKGLIEKAKQRKEKPPIATWPFLASAQYHATRCGLGYNEDSRGALFRLENKLPWLIQSGWGYAFQGAMCVARVIYMLQWARAECLLPNLEVDTYHGIDLLLPSVDTRHGIAVQIKSVLPTNPDKLREEEEKHAGRVRYFNKLHHTKFTPMLFGFPPNSMRQFENLIRIDAPFARKPIEQLLEAQRSACL